MSKVVSSTLKEYFREQGKTQQDIADDLGVSQAYIGQILNGMKPIGKQTASKLNSLYGFNRGWLLTGEGDMLVGGAATVTGNGNAVNTVTGNGNKVSASVAGDFADLASKFAASLQIAQNQLTDSQSQLTKSQEQMDRLIALLEKQQAFIDEYRHD